MSASAAEQQAASRGAAAAAAAATEAARVHNEGAARPRTVRAEREAAEERYREACDAREAALRERVAADGEAARQENRAIDLEWEGATGAPTPQAALAAVMSVQAHCARVLAAKDAVVDALLAELAIRDAAYVEMLRSHGEEADALLAAAAETGTAQHAAHRVALVAVEAAYLQERAELMAATKAEVEALLERRGNLEQSFMERYLSACTAYEDQLEALRAAEAGEYSSLKRRLDGEVAALEAHLDAMLPVYALQQDKLSYNYRVLLERERENKEALLQQKRKVNRQWEVLARLKKQFAEADRQCAGDNARLTDEYQHLTQAFTHLRTKYLHFKAADLRKFGQARTGRGSRAGEWEAGEELAELAGILESSTAQLSQFVGIGVAGEEFGNAEDEQSHGIQPDSSTGAKDQASQPGDHDVLLIEAYRPATDAAMATQPSTTSSTMSSDQPALAVAYWQERARALTGAQLDINWALTERELAKHLGVLQARMDLAQQVATLQHQNQELKAAVREALENSSLPPAPLGGGRTG
eukprot:scaffold2.g7534.t1